MCGHTSYNKGGGRRGAGEKKYGQQARVGQKEKKKGEGHRRVEVSSEEVRKEKVTRWRAREEKTGKRRRRKT